MPAVPVITQSSPGLVVPPESCMNSEACSQRAAKLLKMGRMLSLAMKSEASGREAPSCGAAASRVPHHLQYFASFLFGLWQFWQSFIWILF